MISDSRTSLSLLCRSINLMRFTVSMSASLCHLFCPFINLSSSALVMYLRSLQPKSSTAPPPYSPDTPKCRTLYQRWQRTWGNKMRKPGFQEESERERQREKVGKNPRRRLPYNPTFGTMGATEWQKRQMGWKKKLMNEWINKRSVRKGRTRNRGKKKGAPGSLSACPLLATRD